MCSKKKGKNNNNDVLEKKTTKLVCKSVHVWRICVVGCIRVSRLLAIYQISVLQKKLRKIAIKSLEEVKKYYYYYWVKINYAYIRRERENVCDK